MQLTKAAPYRKKHVLVFPGAVGLQTTSDGKPKVRLSDHPEVADLSKVLYIWLIQHSMHCHALTHVHLLSNCFNVNDVPTADTGFAGLHRQW
jgi:hypothetical protein